jgi:hypothetical protein
MVEAFGAAIVEAHVVGGPAGAELVAAGGELTDEVGEVAACGARLATALVTVTELDDPPQRFVAGADAVAAVEQKAHDLLAQIDAHRALSTNLAHDDAPA